MNDFILCSICLEPTQTVYNCKRQPIKPRTSDDCVLKCKHAYHRTCIHKWIHQNECERPLERSTCPCCRQPIANRHRVVWIRYLTRRYETEFEWLDKYIYYEYTHMILFVNDVKQWSLHYSTQTLNNYSNIL